MNKEQQQRIAIAESVGWKPFSSTLTDRPAWVGPNGGCFVYFEDLPDYLDDLNACAEFEKKLADTATPNKAGLWPYYAHHLAEIVNRDWEASGYEEPMVSAISASAYQRSEAYLLTIEKS